MFIPNLREASGLDPEAVHNLAVGPDGHVHTASRDGTVRELRPDGTTVDTVEHPGSVYEVAVDPVGRRYTAARDGVRKFRPDGTEVWVHDAYDDNVYDVAVDDPRRYRWRGRDGPTDDDRSRSSGVGGLLSRLPFVG